MRIQHNRFAKNAYRNYSGNTVALSKNLEKLSSGFRINRAGDDAAGLAISEKMRAQIAGLSAAQNNVRDGISLVKTAEGALGEIHDILDRMVYLSTQSANGTYDDETDREQLQKEIEQLKAEINRIADSSNFNGINLLDGSLDPDTVRGVIYGSLSAAELGELFLYDDWTGSTPQDVEDGKNVLETEAVATSRAGFQISLDNISVDLSEDDTFTLIIGDRESCDFVTLTLEGEADCHYSSTELAKALAEKYENIPIQLEGSDGKLHNFHLTVSEGSKVLQFTVEDADADDFSLRNYGAVSYQVGDPVDSGEPNAKLTISLTHPIQEDRVSDGGRPIINGDELVFTFSGSAGYKLTLYADRNSDGTVTWKDKGGEDTVLPQGYSFAGFSGGKVVIQADEGGRQEENPFRGLKVTVRQGAVLGGWTYPAETLATSWDRGSGDRAVGSSYAADTPAMIADTSSAQSNPGDYAQFTMKISKGYRLSSLRAATFVFENDKGVKLRFDFNLNKGAFELNLSESSLPLGFGDAHIELSRIGGDGTYDDYELRITAKEVRYVDGNPFEGLRFDIPEGKVTTAPDGKPIVGTTDMYSPGPGIFYNGSDPSSDPGGDLPGEDFPVSNTRRGTLGAGMQNRSNNVTGAPAQLANTVVDFGGVGAWADGAKIFIDPETYTVAIGEDSKFKNVGKVIDLTDEAYAKASAEDKAKLAAQRLEEAAADNRNFIVGHDGEGNTTLRQRGEVKETTDMSTKERLLSYLGVSIADPDSIKNAKPGQPLTLQIGDTSDSYNQLKVIIDDTHTDALGIEGISIADQESAAAAVDKVMAVINTVSDIRSGLGAVQNRLEHTQNNLGVMREEIQDAESTIRDTDVAEEMVGYVKNNILIQSGQAMLAQANQIPQGVLQLLG